MMPETLITLITLTHILTIFINRCFLNEYIVWFISHFESIPFTCHLYDINSDLRDYIPIALCILKKEPTLFTTTRTLSFKMQCNAVNRCGKTKTRLTRYFPIFLPC